MRRVAAMRMMKYVLYDTRNGMKREIAQVPNEQCLEMTKRNVLARARERGLPTPVLTHERLVPR